MNVTLASNFGNLGLFLLAVPALLIAVLSGLVAALYRWFWLSVSSGMLCALIGAALLWHDSAFSAIPVANEQPDHWVVTERVQRSAEIRFLGTSAICLGFCLAAGVFLPGRAHSPASRTA